MTKDPGENQQYTRVSMDAFIEGLDKQAFNVGALHAMQGVALDGSVFCVDRWGHQDDLRRVSYERGRQFGAILKAKNVYWHGHVYDKQGRLINAYQKLFRENVYDFAH